MIYPSHSLAPLSPEIVSKHTRDAHLLDDLREEAKELVCVLFAGVSAERIERAGLPGFGRNGISRAKNGDATNPVFRLFAWFTLCRRLGIPKAWPQRVINGLQRALDAAYDDAPAPKLEEVLDQDAALDGQDEAPRQRAARGDRTALREFVAIREVQLAHSHALLARVRSEVL